MIRNAPQPMTEESPPAELEPAGDGKMWIDGRFRPQLRRARLTVFEEVMDSNGGRCLRELKVRENWYLPAPEPHPSARGLYLKKHYVRTWLSRLRAALGIGPGETPARVEADNVRCLTAEGIDVMRVVAFGEKLHADGLCESFLLTEELAGYADLHAFLLRRFPSGGPRRGTTAARDLDRLIRGVADVARRFHNAGYNHRDFYSCHFLVKETSPGEFDIRLIDLQRVQHRRRFRRRWLVKDLAQLAWSAPRDRVTCRQRIAFMRHYLGVRKLGPAEKRLIRAVLFKQRLMQWRLGDEP
jgi:heptose I phosphotransferase